ncbi:hypothetical protein MMC08_007016 [Hypocenomyce scalaris]|nr:hypothetical protein [Hypocenomyce scalaris]
MDEETLSSAFDETQSVLEQDDTVSISGGAEENDEMRSNPSSTASPSQESHSESECVSPSPPPPSRPNKFHGPPSTWRTWTASERELAASLDRLKARDLAVHLYNAHALKRRARAIDKQGAANSPEPEPSGKAWVPPKVWTAWPMGPDAVPREGDTERWGNEEDMELRKDRRGSTRPSELLGDLIASEVLRNAMQRFRLRPWDRKESPALLEEPNKKQGVDKANTGSEHRMRSDAEDRRNSESERQTQSEEEEEIEPKAKMGSDDHNGTPEEGNGQRENEEESESEGELGRGRRRITTRIQSRNADQKKRSQSNGKKMSSRSLSKSGKKEPRNDGSRLDGLDGMRPAVMADDEQAREILQPTIRHILSKLDYLLKGLHQARQAYLPRNDDTASETQTDGDELSATEKRGNRSGRSKSRPRESKDKHSRDASMRSMRKSRGRSKNVALSTPNFEDARFPSSPLRTPPGKRRRRKYRSPNSQAQLLRKRQARLGLRDWSDILGIASMTGWDPTVVAKAAGRCAALFEEGMAFRTLEEGRQAVNEVSFCPNDVLRETDTLDEDETHTEQVESEDRMLGGVHVDGFLKPIQAKKSWRSRGA